MDTKNIPVPADITNAARRYYRLGFKAGFKGWAVVCPTKKYEDAYWRGYDDGYRAAGQPEVRTFEHKR